MFVSDVKVVATVEAMTAVAKTTDTLVVARDGVVMTWWDRKS